ncbi:MAG: hypothetical protein K8R54_09130 [Bacteroidales bacterium]|nr:hypothetical protein [Bacteroidales bacterium]
MKKSIKYLLIAFVNSVILTILLAIWTDEVELIFNDLIRPIEFFKIIGITLLSLIGMRILVGIYRKRKIYSLKKKVLYSVVLTFIISSYLYVDYSVRIVQNKVINQELRYSILSKVENANMLAYGTTADELTIEEYEEIRKMNWFPKIPDLAVNISYLYAYDGFLPDYIFRLIYFVPDSIEVGVINVEKGDFTKTQRFDIVGKMKKVTYQEDEK